MRTYTKKYGGSIALKDLPYSKGSACPKCGELIVLSHQSVEHYDRENDYYDCVTITGVPGYYCADGCELFLTTIDVDLIVARDIFLISVGFGIENLASDAFNEIRFLTDQLGSNNKKRKSNRQ